MPVPLICSWSFLTLCLIRLPTHRRRSLLRADLNVGVSIELYWEPMTKLHIIVADHQFSHCTDIRLTAASSDAVFRQQGSSPRIFQAPRYESAPRRPIPGLENRAGAGAAG